MADEFGALKGFHDVRERERQTKEKVLQLNWRVQVGIEVSLEQDSILRRIGEWVFEMKGLRSCWVEFTGERGVLVVGIPKEGGCVVGFDRGFWDARQLWGRRDLCRSGVLKQVGFIIQMDYMSGLLKNAS